MNFSIDTPKPVILLLPLLGMGLFVVLYIIAALNYPGGSFAMPDKNGFSFWNNYLCDLLDHYAINGELNSARYFARASLAVLCASLLLLWAYLPLFFTAKSYNRSIMWLSGILSLGTTFFLTSGTHDIALRIAGIFGVLAFITCFVELFKMGYFKLFIFGVVCLFIFLVNYYSYETGAFIRLLPIIQKLTFICCILWFLFLDISFYKKLKSTSAEYNNPN